MLEVILNYYIYCFFVNSSEGSPQTPLKKLLDVELRGT